MRDGQHDFDFYFGIWKVKNRRLEKPLAGSTSWYEFDGTSVARPIWGGKANSDEYEAQSPVGPIQGMTLRLYNPKTRQWSIYWSNSASGTLDTPMIGEFDGEGHGEFFDQEMFQGRAIYVRFKWTAGTDTCRWEQAFSADGGKTWETNWIMDQTRVG